MMGWWTLNKVPRAFDLGDGDSDGPVGSKNCGDCIN